MTSRLCGCRTGLDVRGLMMVFDDVGGMRQGEAPARSAEMRV